jgi:glycosyltransferase involved in cell wall biosynthesis
VGDVNYNKNVSGLIKACRELDLPLVIAGKQALEVGKESLQLYPLAGPQDWTRFLFNKPHPETAHFEELSQLFTKSKEVVRLGFVEDNDLVALYNLARVYVQPSFYEGFGLPLLEAMACGTPVVASKIGAHMEIADNAVLFADPKNVDDIAKKIKMVFANKNLRQGLIARGLARTKNFSWDKTAKGTLKVYEKVLAKD